MAEYVGLSSEKGVIHILFNVSFFIVFLYREVSLACDSVVFSNKLCYGQKVSRRGLFIL